MGLPFNTESWIWYSVAVSMAVCRLVSRTMLLGSIKKLQTDDWLMLVVLTSYTAFIVTINKTVHYNSNLIAPGEDASQFTPQDIQSRIYGSKLTLVVEQMQCVTVWLLKACLLMLYHRLTDGFRTHKVVMALAAYVAISFVIMEILYFGVWCRPFHNYWAVPTPNKQCSAATDHLITNAVFNISSDCMMLGIAFSLFIRTSLPWNRKLILSCIFGLGIFVILSSILNKYYSFTHPFGSEWTYWYVRESSTNLLVTNIPFTWTILRRIFKLPEFQESKSVKKVAYHSQRSARGRHRPTARQTGSGSNQFSGTIPSRFTMNGSNLGSPVTPPSPVSIRHPTMLVDRPAQSHWRDRGFYGRAELDALGSDIWDDDEEAEIESPGKKQNGSPQSNGHVITRAASSGSHGTPPSDPNSSPTSTRSRRLRDEAAQYQLQERFSPSYQDFTFTSDEDLPQIEKKIEEGKGQEDEEQNEKDREEEKPLEEEKDHKKEEEQEEGNEKREAQV